MIDRSSMQTLQEFPGLPDYCEPADGDRPLRICIVTQDIVGPIRNGGIGTAFRYAAELYADAGHDVTILYTLGTRCETGSIDEWVTHYAELGIRFVPMPQPPVPSAPGVLSNTVKVAYGTYEWLKDRRFDVVHVSEWRGNAYFCLLAKRLGIAFSDTVFCVKTSSPTLWNKLGNGQHLNDLSSLITAFIERRSVELADVVISGSAYMLRWMQRMGYDLPAGRCYVQPNIMPAQNRLFEKDRLYPKELVFFGRLEPRKGLQIFCDAIARLAERVDPPGLKITFLGEQSVAFPSRQYIEKVAQDWPFQWSIVMDKSQVEALRYLGEGSRLAVIPSVVDNSPFGVYECLASGLPFIASDVGGIPELIADESQQEALFPLQPSVLAARIQSALENGISAPRASFDFDRNSDIWLDWHRQWLAQNRRRTFMSSPGPLKDDDAPKVSVCLVHHDRPAYLRHAVESLVRQTYRNFEVVLVDDGSRQCESRHYLAELESLFAEKDWTLIRAENRFVGSARNTAAARATGEYLLFMDDDNVAKPHEIARFVEVAQRSGTDILTCFADVFSGEGSAPAEAEARERITPIGGDLSTGLFRNVFGDTNALIRKSAFDDLGGFREDYKVGKEDQELFARAVLAGHKLEVLPEALYWYRQSERRVRHIHYSASTGETRIAEAYSSAVPAQLRPMLFYAAGQSGIRPGAGSSPVAASAVDTGGLTDVALTMLQNYPRLGRLARWLFRLEMRCFAALLHAQAYVARAIMAAVRSARTRRGSAT